jgi:radical SAM protein with 4Fe4S-binding SPASM domain
MDLELPKVIEIEPSESCNFRCRMCHVSYMPNTPRPLLPAAALDRLPDLTGTHLIIGSGFEPLMNKEYGLLIRKLAERHASLEIVTNASLLDGEILDRLADADLRYVTFSFDGIRKATYEHIRRNANFEQVVENIVTARNRLKTRHTHFTINTTMMRCNMEEVTEIVDFWDKADFDVVSFIAMVVRYNDPALIRESLYPVRHAYYSKLDQAALDVVFNKRRISLLAPYFAKSPLARRFPNNVRSAVVKSDHPGARTRYYPHQEAQLGAGPDMTFDCRSPWTFAKILPNADVQLCYRFAVGNLRQSSFEDIWYGDAANEVRARIVAERRICESCDYYRFCLKADEIDCEDLTNYFAVDLVPGVPSVNFDTGEMTVPRVQDPNAPQFVEALLGHHILQLQGAYIGLPDSLSFAQFQRAKPEELQSIILMAGTVKEVRRLIRTRVAQQPH